MIKKNLSQATTDAVNKFFTPKSIDEINSINITNDTNNNNTNDSIVTNTTNHTSISNDTNITKHTYVSKPTNKSKHYDTRGKRSERYGILLDKQLKDDLQLLCNATNNRSLNDFIVTILLEHVNTPENQKKLTAYKELLKL